MFFLSFQKLLLLLHPFCVLYPRQLSSKLKLMFKSFHGYNLLAKHQDDKKQRKAAVNKTTSKALKIIAVTLISLIVWCMPSDALGIPDLTLTEQRTIAIFIFASLMWLTEAIPSWATSTLVIVILLYTCSDSSLFCFVDGVDEAQLGALIPYKKLMSCFADPIIMLFIGGFILAIAATKVGLDVKMARMMLTPFGTKSENVLLGFLLVTGIFSMFLSNTATAAMMLTFLAPVLKQLPPEGKGRVGLALAIPIGANIGGIGTPIGTPPNAIALKALKETLGMDIGFGQWMMFMFPLVVVLLFISWRLLLKFFPFSQKTVELKIDGAMQKGFQSKVVIFTFILTVALWLSDRFTGINANTVAMVPFCIFALTGVINKRDLEQINWSVIWMVAGGFALGYGLNASGLAANAVESIPFGEFSPLLILMLGGAICYLLSNFISNSATAALLMPILAVVCGAMGDKLAPIGGTGTVLIGVAIAASSAMILPISTPPNALAFATGYVKQGDMSKVGIIMGVISMVLGFGLVYLMGTLKLI